MSFVERFHAILRSTDPRPLVSEVRDGVVVDVPRAVLAARVATARGGFRACGAAPGDRIVLIAPNDADWVAIDLALLLEGLISVPLYARQSPAELAACIADCAPRRVVVTDPALGETLWEAGCRVPIVTREVLFDAPPIISAASPGREGDVVTLAYTSGTADAAKGVRLTRGNVDALLPVTAAALAALVGDDLPDEVVFHDLPLCFLASRLILWTALWRESGIVLSSDPDRATSDLPVAAPTWFLDAPRGLERLRVGVEQAIGQRSLLAGCIWRTAKRAWAKHCDGVALGRFDRFVLQQAEVLLFAWIRARLGRRVQFVLSGTAPLSIATQRWFEMIGLPIYQLYGLAETCAIVSIDRPGEGAAGWVGYPITGCEVRVGQHDELLVRGPTVFDGYWNRPDATAAVFVDGWLRTGDKARLAPDGRLAIVGRTKSVIVPSTGDHVAPEPVEQRLVDTIAGADHVVLVGHGRPYLAALVTGAVRDADARRGFDAVNALLPRGHQVRRWACVDDPLTHEDGLLTASGKLRRRSIEVRFADAIEALYR